MTCRCLKRLGHRRPPERLRRQAAATRAHEEKANFFRSKHKAVANTHGTIALLQQQQKRAKSNPDFSRPASGDKCQLRIAGVVLRTLTQHLRSGPRLLATCVWPLLLLLLSLIIPLRHISRLKRHPSPLFPPLPKPRNGFDKCVRHLFPPQD